MKSNYKRIGQYVRQVKKRNTDLAVMDLKGINIDKVFMPSVANTTGTDLSKYKIVRQYQFAFNPMHVGRDGVLPISMLETKEPVIVSPAYVVFKVIDPNELDPEYLMMWFRRPEFDRNAWFTTDSSVRGGFSWDDFCVMTLPVPHIDTQREIVREYNTVVDRIRLNEGLIQKLEETAQAIYKHWFVDFEFPISKEYAESIGKPELEGMPYQSSGGEMVYSDELDMEIPVIWKPGQLGDLLQLQRGFDLPTRLRANGDVPIYAANGLTDFHSESKVKGPGIVTGRSGTIGNVFFVNEDFWPLNTTLWIKKFKSSRPIHAYFTLQRIDLALFTTGSAVPTLNRNHVHTHPVVIPPIGLVEHFESLILKFFKTKKRRERQIKRLQDFGEVLGSLIATRAAK